MSGPGLLRRDVTPPSLHRDDMTRAPSSDSILSAITADNPSNTTSISSTPPTSVDDSLSEPTTSATLYNPDVDLEEASPGRVRRARTKVTTYNVKRLSGTAIHMPLKFSTDPKIREKSKPTPRPKRNSLGVLVGDGLLPEVSTNQIVAKSASIQLRHSIGTFQSSGADDPTAEVSGNNSRHSTGTIIPLDMLVERVSTLGSSPGRKNGAYTSPYPQVIEDPAAQASRLALLPLKFPSPFNGRPGSKPISARQIGRNKTLKKIPKKLATAKNLSRSTTIHSVGASIQKAQKNIGKRVLKDLATPPVKSGQEEDEEKCMECSGLKSTQRNPIILCETCDNAIHLQCSNYKKVPKGDWFCAGCQPETFEAPAPMEEKKRLTREERRLLDTPEFKHIDTSPVIQEVWSNGKLVTEDGPPRKRKKVDISPPAESSKEQMTTKEQSVAPKEKFSGKRRKTWLKKGLYAGQESDNFNWNLISNEQNVVEPVPSYTPNSFMPLPMFQGQKMIQAGRDFKLPWDVCSPLPPGQPKPQDWSKRVKNKLIGEAKQLWKKSDHLDNDSKCTCSPEDGCDDNCQNRVMLYECDENNCSAGAENCSNRAFAQLKVRTSMGGPYRIGVEPVSTLDRGTGVRSTRCFQAHQLITEYTGEIITEDECDRRMNEDYKDKKCYYMMSFDQHMILDGYRGSIARFVNHSCKPNCKMVKWLVSGKPRMALFAGDNPIMTGDELTYDYNFDPFSIKNVQECRCGSDNCRGVLGPKPKDVKQTFTEVVKAGVKAVKAGVKAGKRKLQEITGALEEEDDVESQSPKERKLKPATGARRPVSSAKTGTVAGVAKAGAAAITKSVKRMADSLHNARVDATPDSPKRQLNLSAKAKANALKTYGRSNSDVKLSRKSSLTLTARKSRLKGSFSKRSILLKRPKISSRKISTKATSSNKRISGSASEDTILVASPDEVEADRK